MATIIKPIFLLKTKTTKNHYHITGRDKTRVTFFQLSDLSQPIPDRPRITEGDGTPDRAEHYCAGFKLWGPR